MAIKQTLPDTTFIIVKIRKVPRSLLYETRGFKPQKRCFIPLFVCYVHFILLRKMI